MGTTLEHYQILHVANSCRSFCLSLQSVRELETIYSRIL